METRLHMFESEALSKPLRALDSKIPGTTAGNIDEIKGNQSAGFQPDQLVYKSNFTSEWHEQNENQRMT